MFKDELARFMSDNDLTQKDVAMRVGVSQQTVSQWLLGNGFPKTARIKTVSDMMGIPVETLLQYSVTRYAPESA